MGFIYKITNNINNKVYIGQTKQKLSTRIYGHMSFVKADNKRHLYQAIRKYGKDQFSVSIVEECDNQLLSDREKYYISLYNATDPEHGYNMTAGGESLDFTKFKTDYPDKYKERNEKISKALQGRKQSKESVEKRRLSMIGKRHSTEARQKMSASRKGKSFKKHTPTSQETKEKIRLKMIGKVQSKETCAKRAAAMHQLHWFNNGLGCVRATECPEGYVPGRLKVQFSQQGRINSSHSGTHWFTNGIINKMLPECPEGFWPGKTKKTSNK